jgi:hypothetical protein
MRLTNIRLVLLFSAIFLLTGCEKNHPKINDSIDKIYLIGIDPLPKGWTTDWQIDKESTLRLKLLSPKEDLMLKVYAFKGDLDKKKFEDIDKTILDDEFTAPYKKESLFEYDTEVQRRWYKVITQKGGTVYSEFDFIWHQAKKSYAYIIEVRYVGDGSNNIETARSSLHLYPPKLTALGKGWNILGTVLDLEEAAEGGIDYIKFVILMILGFLCAAFMFGSWLQKLSLPIKSLIAFTAIVAIFLCKAIFHLKWWVCIVLIIGAAFVIGTIIAYFTDVPKNKSKGLIIRSKTDPANPKKVTHRVDN